MLTASDIDAMNEVQAQSFGERQAIALLGTNQYKKPLAEHLGMSYEGIKNWFRPGNRPTTAALMYLQSEIERRYLVQSLQVFSKVLDSVRQ